MNCRCNNEQDDTLLEELDELKAENHDLAIMVGTLMYVLGVR